MSIDFAGLLMLPVVWSPFPREQGVRRCRGNSIDSNTEALFCKNVGKYGVREIKLLQEHFWLVLLKLAVTAGVLRLAKSVCQYNYYFCFVKPISTSIQVGQIVEIGYTILGCTKFEDLEG